VKLSTLSSSLAAIALSTLALSAHAGFYTYTGDTTGGPTFNRPDIDYADYPFQEVPSGLSGDATDVAYHALTFTVGVSGIYTFLTQSDDVNYDTFVILYSGTFNPADALTNAVAASDDAVFPNTSGLVFSLVAGNSYTYVVTGYDNDQFGAFSTTISGPGAIAAVPEPASYGLMGLGVAGLAAFARRRRVALDD
jgi:hypothetical protein